MASSFNEGADDSFRQWNEIPVWDGQAHTLKRFAEDVEWWLESLDEHATLKYNLAARFVRKQRGIVAAKCKEFSPADLRAVREIKDPGDRIVQAGNYRAGIDILLAAFQGLAGVDSQTKKGELLDQWHKKTARRSGERIIDFALRFKKLRKELEGVGSLYDDEEELGM